MTELPEFEPCPFCGEGVHHPTLLTAQLFGLEYPSEGNLYISYSSFGWACVGCVECGMSGPKVRAPHTMRDNDKLRAAMIDAVKAWNNRKVGEQLALGVDAP